MIRVTYQTILTTLVFLAAVPAWAQDVLPFPDPPMGGKVGPTMQESVHKWREAPDHLPKDAPNILIVMLDDAGFGQPSTFDVGMDTLSPVADAYFDKAPFEFEGTLNRLHFKYLEEQ